MSTKKEQELIKQRDKLIAKQKQITAKLQKQKALNKERERKKRTKIHILLGIMLDAEIKNNIFDDVEIQRMIKTHLTKKEDSDLVSEYLFPTES
ncbi:hypothetical protein HRM2_p00100 (plasmid) [Desulforapulum autotrophicum HRM2]|uniref:Mobilization protein n=1 Tax=Desulforapulum autotrophicum (strain ATCC 43914 / DSM 3382 / VKM B-1955 / HRM2) TaxID=177437 RepID=C0QML0_DESAH|nr:hypothetical protein [Desulforapulum autotrophicum]ACN18004.1 hypothetical protein HRM2_p00100 [Desulforapulum autotrophicum HRM2]